MEGLNYELKEVANTYLRRETRVEISYFSSDTEGLVLTVGVAPFAILLFPGRV
jgi:hypothetical protein